jgi:hypothetical protein
MTIKEVLSTRKSASGPDSEVHFRFGAPKGLAAAQEERFEFRDERCALD